MVCAGCKNIKEDKKVDGKASGCKYYCSKIKKYISASNEVCTKYEKNYLRDIDTYNEMYKDGNNFSDDTTSTSTYLIIGIIALILTLVFFLLNRDLY